MEKGLKGLSDRMTKMEKNIDNLNEGMALILKKLDSIEEKEKKRNSNQIKILKLMLNDMENEN